MQNQVCDLHSMQAQGHSAANPTSLSFEKFKGTV
jgi:hypothetical protein